MGIKKSQLYASLWASCDELRGGMDASQYKDYVLTLLFLKSVSDKAAVPGDATLIVVPPGGGFSDMVKLKGNKDIGDKINKIIGRLADANELKGVIDQADFNDESKLGRGKEMQDRLSKLVSIFEGLDLRGHRASAEDLLGDAYEYLMRHFATESGKSKGQFYTPAEVSRVVAKVIGIGPDTPQYRTVYDPACGSGSLLLRANAEAPRGLSVYGQEKDHATYALARMNMILHDTATAELWHGNTLSAPYFLNAEHGLKTFDFAVANPPFSDKAWSNGLNPVHDAYGRFAYGVPPAKNGDYAFLLHFLASLKSNGKGAIILPHGVLFRGNREGEIRKALVKRGFIKGIIGLPANLFYGTGIPACILVIDKEKAPARRGIFLIDASRGFLKAGNKNRLRARDIDKIVRVFTEQREMAGYARLVPVSEIASAANAYNLNIPRYLDASEAEDLHDLDAHLNGGIPESELASLEGYWKVFPTLREELFESGIRPGYSDVRVEAEEVKSTIVGHHELEVYRRGVERCFHAWREVHTRRLFGIEVGTSPKAVIDALSADLLTYFADAPLLDAYDVYQGLMDYWEAVMQDDVYLIAAEGWREGVKPRALIQDKRIKEAPDLVVKRKKYKLDLIPPGLIVARYFSDEQAAIECLQASHERAAQEVEAFVEEHAAEGGALAGLEGARGISKGNVLQRVMEYRDIILREFAEGTAESEQAKAIKKASFGACAWTKGVKDAGCLFAELDVLYEYLQLIGEETRLQRLQKETSEALAVSVLGKYAELREIEIKTLVVEGKWLASIHGAIEAEIEGVTQALTGSVQGLAGRYAMPLRELAVKVSAFSAQLEVHLKNMGIEWTGI